MLQVLFLRLEKSQTLTAMSQLAVTMRSLLGWRAMLTSQCWLPVTVATSALLCQFQILTVQSSLPDTSQGYWLCQTRHRT